MEKLLIKISGEIFSDKKTLENVVDQIKKIISTNKVGIVLGGGNFFRGAKDNNSFNLKPESAHNIGMLSTIVNGIIFKDLLSKAGIESTLLSAFPCQKVSKSITESEIEDAFSKKQSSSGLNPCVIFVGGTGNPFFTTDTNAVLRAIQIEAKEIWKATKVDGVFDSDPLTNKNAKFYKTISYQEVLEKRLEVTDPTAITLAQENSLPIRVFNFFQPDALQKALENPDFGSTIR